MVLAGGWPSWAGRAGSARFHSQTEPTVLAARVFPSGLNATEANESTGPDNGWPSRVGRAGSARFHSQTEPRGTGGQDLPVGAERHRAAAGPVSGWPSGVG